MYTLQEKTQPTRHMLSTLSPCMVHDHTYLTRSAHSNLSYSHQQIWTDPLHLRRRAPDTIHSTTAIRFAGPYPASLPQQSKSSGEKSSSCWQPTTKLIGPISPVCDRYVQYLHAGANRTVLNQHRRGYSLGGAGLPHTHSLTFSTSCPHFPLMALPGLHFNKVLARRPKCWVFKEPMAAMWSFDYSAIYISLHLRLAIDNDLSLVVGHRNRSESYSNTTRVSIQLL
jgi:hypothetical protein